MCRLQLHRQIRNGFTFIELLLVVTIIAVLGASVSPFLTRFMIRNAHETTTQQVLTAIRKAQSYALSGKDNAVWGICIQSDTVRFFKSSCSSPSYHEDNDIPASVLITGLSTTTFSLGRGEPSTALSISITNAIGNSTTITVNQAGMIARN